MTTEEKENKPQAAPVRETTQNYASPEANIFETHDGYVLEVELPGVSKAGLEIHVENNTFSITGHRAKAEPTATQVYRESSPMDFRRVFELDPAIDADKIEARLEQGVLTVRLPKSERAKSRKIPLSD